MEVNIISRKIKEIVMPIEVVVEHSDGTMSTYISEPIRIVGKNATQEFKDDLKKDFNIDFDKMVNDIDFAYHKQNSEYGKNKNENKSS